MECVVAKPEVANRMPGTSDLKRKHEEYLERQSAQFKSSDELAVWLHTTGVLEATRAEFLKAVQLDAKHAATEEQRQAFNTVLSQLTCNAGRGINYAAIIGATILRKLQETNQLGNMPGTSSKAAKTSKKSTPSTAKA